MGVATISHTTEWVLVGAAALWLTCLLAIPAYGHDRGFPFFPLFLATLLLGPFGPGLVLLAIAIGSPSGFDAEG